MLTQPRQRLLQHSISAQGGRGVAVLNAPVINRDYLIARVDQLCGDGTQHGLLHHSRPCACCASKLDRVLCQGLKLRLAHFKHERPVGALARVRVARFAAVGHTQSGQGLPVIRAIGLSIVGEDGAPVVGAVVLGVVQPALGAMWAFAADAQPDDVAGAVLQLVRPFLLAEPAEHDIQWQRGQQGVVPDLGAALQGHHLGFLVDARHCAVVSLVLLGKQASHTLPDCTRASVRGEAEHRIRAPACILLSVDDIGDGAVHVHSGHTLPQPVALHHGGWHRPHLEVVGAHEDVCNARPHDPQDPLIK
mmetsp:Transcript_4213/g.11363  ORF Transcript_4213/g.11363 Transcript_4213/m.11363 type:complete len:305 (-) Transcript_4213:467-1381(-)